MSEPEKSTQDSCVTFTLPLSSVRELLTQRKRIPRDFHLDMIQAVIESGEPVDHRILRRAMCRSTTDTDIIEKLLSVTVLDTEDKFQTTLYARMYDSVYAKMILRYLLDLPDTTFEIAKRACDSERLAAFDSIAQDTACEDDLAKLFIRLGMLPDTKPSLRILMLCARAGLVHPNHSVKDISRIKKLEIQEELSSLRKTVSDLTAELERVRNEHNEQSPEQEPDTVPLPEPVMTAAEQARWNYSRNW